MYCNRGKVELGLRSQIIFYSRHLYNWLLKSFKQVPWLPTAGKMILHFAPNILVCSSYTELPSPVRLFARPGDIDEASGGVMMMTVLIGVHRHITDSIVWLTGALIESIVGR